MLRQGETEDIEISLFIPKDIKEPHQVVMFRLRDTEGICIGQPLIAFIKVGREDQSQEPKISAEELN